VHFAEVYESGYSEGSPWPEGRDTSELLPGNGRRRFLHQPRFEQRQTVMTESDGARRLPSLSGKDRLDDNSALARTDQREGERW